MIFSVISDAEAFVKVETTIFRTLPKLSIWFKIFSTITLVLPLPAEAKTILLLLSDVS